MGLDINDVKDLINRIDSSNFTELELNMDGAYLRLNKNTQGARAQTTKHEEILEKEGATQKSEEIKTVFPDETPLFSEGTFIKSPIVGTFYAAPSPSSPPFVKIGDIVKVGDVLCVVEAMKVMNEIVSSHSGKVAEICVENEQLVEYGQDLIRIV